MHTGPAAQVPADWCDDQAPARGGTMDCKHRVIDRIRTAHKVTRGG